LTALRGIPETPGRFSLLETFLDERMKIMKKYIQALIGLFIKTSYLNSKLLSVSISGSGGRTLEDVRNLLDRGAQVDAEDAYKNTPLHMAALNGHTEVARLLIDRGANVNAENADKQTHYTWLHVRAARGLQCSSSTEEPMSMQEMCTTGLLCTWLHGMATQRSQGY
jgi:ankyrin repeat protein